MKKIVRLTGLILSLVLAFVFAGCDPAPEENQFDFQSVYEIAVEYGFNGTLEDLIEAFKGDNAYAVAVSHGYSGSEADWLATLAGAKGDDGITPHIGENGNWFVGEVDTGVKAQGPKGDNGKDGTVWHIGEGGPSEALGKDGDFYIDTSVFKVYLKGGGNWFLIGSIKGESAYDIYLKYHPEYEGDEEQWMDDLVSGRLADKETEKPTEGLLYTLSPDGQSYSVSVGTASNEIKIVIASVYEGKPVTAISGNAFLDCDNIEHIRIPEGVTSIDGQAFYDCHNLMSIVIPASVRNIGRNVFDGNNMSIGDPIPPFFSMCRIFYGGADKAEWDSIVIGADNPELKRKTPVYYSKTQPSQDAHHYWLWVDGVPTFWNWIIGV